MSWFCKHRDHYFPLEYLIIFKDNSRLFTHITKRRQWKWRLSWSRVKWRSLPSIFRKFDESFNEILWIFTIWFDFNKVKSFVARFCSANTSWSLMTSLTSDHDRQLHLRWNQLGMSGIALLFEICPFSVIFPPINWLIYTRAQWKDSRINSVSCKYVGCASTFFAYHQVMRV